MRELDRDFASQGCHTINQCPRIFSMFTKWIRYSAFLVAALFASSGTAASNYVYHGQLGGAADAPGTFRSPQFVAYARGARFGKQEIVVADYGNVRLQLFDMDGRFLSQIAMPSSPIGVAVDPATNNFVV